MLFCVWNVAGVFAYGQEAICAKVQMDVRQELTLARQAFEARMKINNGLPNTTLSNIQVTLKKMRCIH